MTNGYVNYFAQIIIIVEEEEEEEDWEGRRTEKETTESFNMCEW